MASLPEVHSHVPYGIEGSGHYADHSLTAAEVLKKSTDLILEALDKIIVHEKGLYTICDYGCADGGNSLDIIRNCIDKVKSKHPKAEVQVLYEDQTTNDFKSLFYILHGYIGNQRTYLNDFKDVFVGAIGTGFYQQCLPSNSVDLGICTTAAHWLSRRPCELKDCFVHNLSKDEEERRSFSECAAEDWETFLLHRSKELAPGGQAVIVISAIDDEGHYPAFTKNVKEPVYETMAKIWRSMMNEGMLTREEYINTTVNCYLKNRDEISAPFANESSPVWKAGLRLVKVDIETIQGPFYEELVNNGYQGTKEEREAFAYKFVGDLRVWSNHTMYSALSGDRLEEERRKIIDIFYQRYHNHVAENPTIHDFGVPNGRIHIEKIADQ